MVYLISYDIKDANKADDAKVIEILKQSGAVRCLYSEWLLESSKSAYDIATEVNAHLSAGDRLLVVRIGTSAYTTLLNETSSKALLGKA